MSHPDPAVTTTPSTSMKTSTDPVLSPEADPGDGGGGEHDTWEAKFPEGGKKLWDLDDDEEGRKTKKEEGSEGPLRLSPIVFGAATFSSAYSLESHLRSTRVPEETLTYAFRLGINAVDTSPYYSTSEAILGRIFKDPKFAREFPRDSYYIITKAGRYGPHVRDFDYSRERIEASVENSLKKMGTDYLDVVYLHDVEFVCHHLSFEPILPSPLLPTSTSLFEIPGLSPTQIGQVMGEGDAIVLDAARELFRLKAKGKIRRVGIAGYPLPVLLRLSLLISCQLSQSLDILQTYCHHTIQNDVFSDFAPYFLSPPNDWLPTPLIQTLRSVTTTLSRGDAVEEGKKGYDWLSEPPVKQLINASPFSMGLLRSSPPQPWHAAPPELKNSVIEAATLCREKSGGEISLEKLALSYGLTGILKEDLHEKKKKRWTQASTVVGLSNPKEVDDVVEVWKQRYAGDWRKKRMWRAAGAKSNGSDLWMELEREIVERFKKGGHWNWSWASPPQEAME